MPTFPVQKIYLSNLLLPLASLPTLLRPKDDSSQQLGISDDASPFRPSSLSFLLPPPLYAEESVNINPRHDAIVRGGMQGPDNEAGIERVAKSTKKQTKGRMKGGWMRWEISMKNVTITRFADELVREVGYKS